MGTRNWGIELWDRLSDVISYSNHTVTQVEHFSKLCEAYRKSQLAHAKRLKKLLKTHLSENQYLSQTPPTGSEASYPAPLASLLHQSTFIQAQRYILSALEEEATQCTNFANELDTKMTQPLAKDAEIFRRQWRDQRDQVQYLNEQFSQQKTQFEQCQRRYHESYRDWQRLEEGFAKAMETRQLTSQELAKHRIASDAKRATFDRRRGDYAKALVHFNHRQLQFYGNDLADWSLSQTRLHENRYSALHERVIELQRLVQGKHVALMDKQNSLWGQSLAVLAVDKDGEKVVDSLRTGNVFPSDLPFIDLENASTNPEEAPQLSKRASESEARRSSSPSASSQADVSAGSSIDQKAPPPTTLARGGRPEAPNSGNSRFRRSSLGRLSHKVRKGLGQIGASISATATHATPGLRRESNASTPRGIEARQSVYSVVSSNSSGSNNTEQSVQNNGATGTVQRPGRSRMPTSTPIESRTLRTLSQTRQSTFTLRKSAAHDLTSPSSSITDGNTLTLDGHEKYVESIKKLMAQIEASLQGAQRNRDTYAEGSQPFIEAQNTVRMYQTKLVSLDTVRERHQNLMQRMQAAREHFRRQFSADKNPPSNTAPSGRKPKMSGSSSSSGSNSTWSSASSNASDSPDVVRRTTQHHSGQATAPTTTTRESTTSTHRQLSTQSSTESSSTPASPGANFTVCVAIVDYTPVPPHPQCLTFKARDVFHVLQPDQGVGWTYVSTADGSRRGMVPTNYMQPASQQSANPTSAALRSPTTNPKEAQV